MPHDLGPLLRDLQVFVAKMHRHVSGHTYEAFEADEVRIDAVLHTFVQIAEALKRVERLSPELHHRVSSIREIANFRNVIVHDYDQVDLDIVWDSAINDMPSLKQQIDAWAAELGMEALPE